MNNRRTRRKVAENTGKPRKGYKFRRTGSPLSCQDVFLFFIFISKAHASFLFFSSLLVSSRLFFSLYFDMADLLKMSFDRIPPAAPLLYLILHCLKKTQQNKNIVIINQ